jgi:hypothetical protein
MFHGPIPFDALAFKRFVTQDELPNLAGGAEKEFSRDSLKSSLFPVIFVACATR